MAGTRFIVVILLTHFLCVPAEDFRVVYEWFKLDFSWPDTKTKSDAYLQGQYIPENNIIQNIRIWRDRAFLTLPRFKPGVPVTLATITVVPRGGSASPRLDPYPSWEFQKIGECKYLQNVQGIEVDPDGYIWIVDAGSVNLFTTDQKCKPKILIFDIEQRELIASKELSDLVPEDGIFGDIVLDPRKPKTAYISFSTNTESFVLVYNNQTTYKLKGLPISDSKKIYVNGTGVFLRNKLSLALSLSDNKLYISSSSSPNLYSVSLLHVLGQSKDIKENLIDLGNKSGLSTGMIVDSKDNLYFGLIEKDSIAKWNTKSSNLTVEIFHDGSLMQWPDSFGFDDSGSIWAVTNRYQTYIDSSVNTNIPNFRLLQAYTGSKSYLFGNYSNLFMESSGSKNVFCVSVLFVIYLFVATFR